MKKIESIFWSFALGFIPPIVGSFILGICAYVFSSEKVALIIALIGFITGCMVDGFFLKKWVNRVFQLDLKIWMGIYIFYSVFLFGLFMGVPVFNLLLAIPAGFFMGARLVHRKTESEQGHQLTRQTCVFTTLVMAVICVASAVIALSDPYTGGNLQGMFQLGFEVTPLMIVGIIIVGGSVLLSLNWWLTSKSIQLSHKWIQET